MEIINVKNIGFKKYMEILEDIQRNSNNNRLSILMNLDTRDTFAAVLSQSLEVCNGVRNQYV